MRVEFYRQDDPKQAVGVAHWDGRRAQIEADDDSVRAALGRIFRATPVVVEDGAYRYLGAGGEALIQPGGLDWFREAALTRSAAEGLSVRLVPELTGEGGWDPAAAYRTFREDVKRLFDRANAAAAANRRQPGEATPEERTGTDPTLGGPSGRGGRLRRTPPP